MTNIQHDITMSSQLGQGQTRGEFTLRSQVCKLCHLGLLQIKPMDTRYDPDCLRPTWSIATLLPAYFN